VSNRVDIKKLKTGVRGLDEVLGGGLPELSFNLIAGGPGGGKTTLAHQIMFSTASVDQPALYITILGEPPLKMLRYQQQYAFFDADKVGTSIRFLYLGSELLDHGLESVLRSIIKEVEATSPKLVFVDSFRAVVRKSMEPGEMKLQSFVERLSLHLTSWEATTFLIGEYEEREADCNPIFTIADGILWLSQVAERNSVVRKLQIVKMRGQGPAPGLHSVRISDAGLRVFPRLPGVVHTEQAPLALRPRRRTGIAGLDALIGGGIPAGYSVLIVGPSGSGKTVMSTQFIREGIAAGEPGVIAVFEKRPEEYMTAAPGVARLETLVADGMLRMLYLRPLDLSVDETMEEIIEAVEQLGAKRVVIDSLIGFELALAPSFRAEFRESLYRLVGGLVQLGVTVIMTAELAESYTELRLTPPGVSFLTDAIILQRYWEQGGELRKLLTVVKMRGFAHSKALKLYDITSEGIVIGETLAGYEHILVGEPSEVAGPHQS